MNSVSVFTITGRDYQIISTYSFGDCLFLAISYGLNTIIKQQQNALDIRKKAAAFIAQEGIRFEEPVCAELRNIQTSEKYEEYMSTEGVYGGEPELCAISEI